VDCDDAFPKEWKLPDEPDLLLDTAAGLTMVPHLFEDDPLIPVYGKEEQPCDTKSIVLAICAGVNENFSSKIVPSQPIGDYSFMVETKYLASWKDVLSDDLGVWHPIGTKTYYFRRTFDADGGSTLHPISKDQKNEADLQAKRYLYNYPNEKSFKGIVVKTLTKSEDDEWKISPHIYVQYYFEGGVKEIVVPPHGNAKTNTPFVRTKDSTKEKIRTETKSGKKSKAIVSSILKEQGGILQVKII